MKRPPPRRHQWRGVAASGRTKTFADRGAADAWATARGGHSEPNPIGSAPSAMRRKEPIKRTPAKRPTKKRAVASSAPVEFDPRVFSDYPPEVVVAVCRRADYRCEARLPGCSDSFRLGLHHRLPRSPVRHDTPANLLLACADCHTASPEAIHRNPARAYAVGLLIRRSEAPPSEPWDPALRSLY